MRQNNRNRSLVRLWMLVGVLLVLVSLAVIGRKVGSLLGFSGPRSYLIIAQNEDELRATGGFISAAGLVTLERGKVTGLEFMDSYAVDDLQKDYPDPPEPLRTYMEADLWLFRDSNWSPDFPSAARQMAGFYIYGQGKPVDGVIALDQGMVQLVVHALGGVQLDTHTGPVFIRDDEVVDFMRSAWGERSGDAAQWFGSRKDFISSLAKALEGRVAHAGVSEWPALAQAALTGLNERHLLVYVFDPDWAQLLAASGWDGALHQGGGDYLMPVDANVGFNKANALVSQSYTYTVTIDSQLRPHATLEEQLEHGGQPSAQACKQYVPDLSVTVPYGSLINECLFDFMRIYVPAGAALRDETITPVGPGVLLKGRPTTGTSQVESAEDGYTVFSKLVMVAQAQRMPLRFSYDLPPSTVQSLGLGAWQYALYWQKQPGSHGGTATVVINLPPAASLLFASTGASTVSAAGNSTRIVYSLKLDTDQALWAIFRPG